LNEYGLINSDFPPSVFVFFVSLPSKKGANATTYEVCVFFLSIEKELKEKEKRETQNIGSDWLSA